MSNKLLSLNIKFFIYLLSQRRNFIPILSIYFLTIPNTVANQIWIYTWIGYLASFLLEIPSGYIADRIGHKKTLIISKVFQCISILFFIIWWTLWSDYSFILFIVWSVFQACGFSFFSWTTSAFFHEILEDRWEEKNFSKFMSQIKANVSLVSAFIIVLLPFLTSLHITAPLIIALLFDILWLFMISIIPSPRAREPIKIQKWIIALFYEAKVSKTLHVSVFIWGIIGFMIWEHAYRTIYLESLGYPIIFIWFVMWLSRVIWFIIWHYAHNIEKYLTMRQHFFWEVFLFPIFFLLIAYFNNPYVVWILFSLIIWYQQGRKPIMEWYLLNNYITDKRYKATFLSMESQVNSFISTIITFLIWFVMAISYKIWYITLSFSLFLFLIISFYFIFREERFRKI